MTSDVIAVVISTAQHDCQLPVLKLIPAAEDDVSMTVHVDAVPRCMLMLYLIACLQGHMHNAVGNKAHACLAQWLRQDLSMCCGFTSSMRMMISLGTQAAEGIL